MNIIEKVRTKSIITKKENLEHLFTIKDFPVFIGNTEQSFELDIFCDMIFDICKDSGIIQIRNLPKPELIYPKYHSEAIGKIWQQHHLEFSEMMLKIFEDNNFIKNILEIGGSNANLASLVLKQNKNLTNWKIIDPNLPETNDSVDQRLEFTKSFFEDNIEKMNGTDVIVHSHTLEHAEDPEMFLRMIYDILPEDGMQIFSVPNLYTYLEKQFSNILNFEHTIFLTEEMIDILLVKSGFKTLNKIYFSDHSIFYITKKLNFKNLNLDIPDNYNKYKNMYLKYVEYYSELIVELNKKIESFDGDIYLFGGHIFSQMLITFGLNTDKIKFILDNSVTKNNTRLYGSNLQIKLPEEVNIKDGSVIILKVGSYKNEISEKLKTINPNIIFWE